MLLSWKHALSLLWKCHSVLDFMHCHKENAISKESEGKGVTSMSLALLKFETSMAYAKHKKNMEHNTQ